MIKNLSIRFKMFLSLGSVLLAGTAVFLILITIELGDLVRQSVLKTMREENELIKGIVASGSEASVSNFLDAAAEKTRALAEYYYREYRRGVLSEKEAKSRFAATVLDPAFGRIGQTGYLAVLDSHGVAVIHPLTPGKDLSSLGFIRQAIERKAGFLLTATRTRARTGLVRKRPIWLISNPGTTLSSLPVTSQNSRIWLIWRTFGNRCLLSRPEKRGPPTSWTLPVRR